ncbi:MAG TPA: beta-ketoacyl synthase N-terminal-like domain-containing protein, partial [Streptosporangiaceae bacterium]
SASSALAVIAAARLVAEGHAQRCLVVAPHCELSPAEFRALHDSGAMAHHAFLDQPHRVCRPFDQDRQGFVYGQGAAAVLLERTGPGIEPLALILGHGQRLDGRRGTEPNPAGQAAAIRAALLAARLRPGEVDYVNTHGTGSPAGDVSEAKAVYEVFGSGPWINSTKPLLGHCMGAAGLQELIATILQLRHGFVHPNPNLELPLDIPLRFAGHTASAARIRVAVSNSFAFSGINASIVVGEI